MKISVRNAVPETSAANQLTPGDKFRYRQSNNVQSDLYLFLGRAAGMASVLCLSDSTFEINKDDETPVIVEGHVMNLQISLS